MTSGEWVAALEAEVTASSLALAEAQEQHRDVAARSSAAQKVWRAARGERRATRGHLARAERRVVELRATARSLGAQSVLAEGLVDMLGGNLGLRPSSEPRLEPASVEPTLLAHLPADRGWVVPDGSAAGPLRRRARVLGRVPPVRARRRHWSGPR